MEINAIMLEQSFIIAFIVLAIWYTMQEGEIFAGLGRWFEKHAPSFMHQPLYECNVCMSPYYGSALYILIYGISWQWPLVVITAMGINAALNKLSPDRDSNLESRVEDLENDMHQIFPKVR